MTSLTVVATARIAATTAELGDDRLAVADAHAASEQMRAFLVVGNSSARSGRDISDRSLLAAIALLPGFGLRLNARTTARFLDGHDLDAGLLPERIVHHIPHRHSHRPDTA